MAREALLGRYCTPVWILIFPSVAPIRTDYRLVGPRRLKGIDSHTFWQFITFPQTWNVASLLFVSGDLCWFFREQHGVASLRSNIDRFGSSVVSFSSIPRFQCSDSETRRASSLPAEPALGSRVVQVGPGSTAQSTQNAVRYRGIIGQLFPPAFKRGYMRQGAQGAFRLG